MASLSPPFGGDDVLVAGYDINGFSIAVEQIGERHGREAGEIAAAALARGSRVVVERLAAAGLEQFDSSGDGLLFMGRPRGPDEARAMTSALPDAERLHFEASGLAIRSAATSGTVRRADLGSLVPGQRVLHWGDPIDRLHRALAVAPRGKQASRFAMRDGARNWIADCDGKLQSGQCMFVRIFDAGSWAQLLEPDLRAYLAMITDWCGPMEACAERLSHDEKGIMLRLAIPAERRLANDDVQPLVDALNARGANCAVACASGDIFRGQLGGVPIVHGHPINQAAKSCASLDRGSIDIRQVRGLSRERAASPVAHPLVGRDEELGEALARYREGASGLALVGEAGIGKTRLARAVWDAMHDAQTPSYWLECNMRRRFQPFGLVRELMAALTRDAAGAAIEERRAFVRSAIRRAGRTAWPEADWLWLIDDNSPALPAHVEGDRADRAGRIGKIAFELMGALTRDRSILVAVDDFHLADSYSAALFRRWAQSAFALRILLTMRAESGAENANLPPDGAIGTIRLGPIDPDAVARLALCHEPKLTQAEVRHVVNIAAGNPFATTVAAAWASQGHDGGADTVARLLRRRVDTLPRIDRLVLRVIAVATDDIPVDRVDTILTRLGQTASAAAAIERLAADGLIEAVDGAAARFRPAHDLIRVAVRGEMSAGATILAAEALVRTVVRAAVPGRHAGATWSEIAQQWELARNLHRAALYYARGAHAALEAGFAAASADLYERALAASEGIGLAEGLHASIWRASLAEAYWAAGKPGEAGEAAACAGNRLRRFRRARRARGALVRAGGIMSETGYFRGRLGDVLRGGAMATRYGGLHASRTLEHCRSNSTIAYVAGLARIPALPAALFGRAHRLAVASRDARPEAYVRATEGILAMIFCRWPACDAHLARSMACLADWPAERQLREVVVTAQGHSAIFQGDFAAARERFQELMTVAEERDNRLHAGWASYMLSLLHLGDGDLGAAATGLDVAKAQLAGLGDVLSDHIVAGIEARIACSTGDPDTALDMAGKAGELSLATPPTNFSSLEGFAAAPLVAAILLGPEAGHEARAKRLFARYRPALRRFAYIFPHARPRLATIDALAAANMGISGAGGAARRAMLRAAAAGMHGELRLAETLLGAARRSGG
ncbi:MAG: AAA family ATPase [Sphingopyxis sp.]|nr:AAA family ATPase [Sphingopyxis sp.]